MVLLANVDLDRGLTNGACGEVIDFVLVTHAATMVGLSPPSPGAKLPLVAFDGLRDPVRVEVVLLMATTTTTVAAAAATTSTNPKSCLTCRRVNVPSADDTRRPPQVVVGIYQWERYHFDVIRQGKPVRTTAAAVQQVPLRLGWGRSIHAAQGTEFDEADVDLSRQFGAHQAYVALSRVKSVRGLRLVARSLRVWTPDEKVRVFVLVLQAAFCVRERLMNRIRLVSRAGGTILPQAGSAPCEVVVGADDTGLDGSLCHWYSNGGEQGTVGHVCKVRSDCLSACVHVCVYGGRVRAWVCASELCVDFIPPHAQAATGRGAVVWPGCRSSGPFGGAWSSFA